MTNIEFVRLVIYGDMTDSTQSDTDICDLIKTMGINGCIETLAIAEIAKLDKKPTQVNDGAVSMAWADRKAGLTETLHKARHKGFLAPEGNDKLNGIGFFYV